MKEHVDTLDATPSKRIYHSIIADYDINKSICELVDNALDIWVKNSRSQDLKIQIFLDKKQQRIQVVDNAGGISEKDLSYVIGPGHTGTTETDKTIGIFGVGTKRAVVALAQDITIRTREEKDTFQLEYDDEWISIADDWSLPVYKVGSIDKGSTVIDLLKLRNEITDTLIDRLIDHVSHTYAKFLESGKVEITINNKPVKPIFFEDWSFPPTYGPIIYSGKLKTSDGTPILVEAVAGLINHSSPATGEYGVYIYCNDRLIARGLKTYDVGFESGIAGKPHAVISIARVIISLKGEARLMPWNSSKSDINPSHEVFIALRSWLLEVVKYFASLARRLNNIEGGWPETVFKHKSGEFKEITIDDFPSVNTAYMPPLPEFRPKFSKIVKQNNKTLANKKPWIIGLYEGIISVDWILKQKFDERNRIALLLLDSTLEIAFKEFLVNESGQAYSDTRLMNIFNGRHQVHNEMKQYSSISQTMWKKIEYYYRMRCQLIHQRATVAISDKQIQIFRTVVEYVLKKLFKIKFA